MVNWTRPPVGAPASGYKIFRLTTEVLVVTSRLDPASDFVVEVAAIRIPTGLMTAIARAWLEMAAADGVLMGGEPR